MSHPSCSCSQDDWRHSLLLAFQEQSSEQPAERATWQGTVSSLQDPRVASSQKPGRSQGHAVTRICICRNLNELERVARPDKNKAQPEPG